MASTATDLDWHVPKTSVMNLKDSSATKAVPVKFSLSQYSSKRRTLKNKQIDDLVSLSHDAAPNPDSQPADPSLDIPNAGKKVEELERKIKFLEALLAKELAMKGEIIPLLLKQGHQRQESKIKDGILEAELGRARLRKQTFDEEMLLVRIKVGVEINGKDATGGRLHSGTNKVIAVEILRRDFLETYPEGPKKEKLMEIFFKDKFPSLENFKYVKGRPNKQPDMVIKEVDLAVKNNQPVKFTSALHAVGSYLIHDLHQVMRIIQSHPLYMDCIGDERHRILSGCLQFFDRAFAYMVWKLSKQDIVCPFLRLATKENSSVLSQLRFTADEIPLDILPHKQVVELNRKAWVNCNGTFE